MLCKRSSKLYLLLLLALSPGLGEVVQASDPSAARVAPSDLAARFLRLQDALVLYRAIDARGGWPQIPARRTLRPGAAGPDVAILHHRLSVSGDLSELAVRPDRYVGNLVDAVERFQRRHGLVADGIIGPKTRAALNVPARQRIVQLAINLERRRRIQDDLGRRYVFINIADAVVKYVEEAKTLLDMRAVVGTPYRKTPTFSALMTEIRFNPSWYVPRRILREDVMPKILRDPSYLAREGFEVLSGGGAAARVIDGSTIDWLHFATARFPYLLRQAPGPGNALGQVKFQIPNRHNIYLHDTPARALLIRPQRAFSSGCIRLEKPLELASALLRDQADWSADRIKQVVARARPVTVHLARPVPVHFTYLTAWVNKDGTVHFRDDIYDRDRALARRLSLPY